jgi:hypothetical protein
VVLIGEMRHRDISPENCMGIMGRNFFGMLCSDIGVAMEERHDYLI